MTLVEHARMFAHGAHFAVGQLRKYTNESYVVHPFEVAQIVATVPHTEEMLAAAWLHDVVEDTGVTLDQVHLLFGANVAELVFWLTDASKPEDGNRAARKAVDRAHIAEAPAAAQTVKCGDLLSNIKSIVKHDPEFAKVYLEEKRLLLEVMTKAHPALLTLVNQLLDESGRDLQLSK